MQSDIAGMITRLEKEEKVFSKGMPDHNFGRFPQRQKYVIALRGAIHSLKHVEQLHKLIKNNIS